MSSNRSMQDVWAATDKPLIDRMKAQTSEAAVKQNHGCFTSSEEESSNSDSDSKSEASFLAVPREFRPNLIAKQLLERKKENAEIPLSNQGLTCPRISSFPTKTPRSDYTYGQATLNSNFIKSLPIKTVSTLNEVDTTKESYDRSKPFGKEMKEKEENILSAYNPNNQATPRSNFLRMKNKTTLFKNKCLPLNQTVFPKQDVTLNQTDSAEKMPIQNRIVALEVVIPKNDKEHLEILDKSGIFKKYFKDNIQTSTNSSSSHNPKVLTSGIHKNNEKGIQFECINVSEHVKLSKTKTIEFDVANMTLDVKTSRTITDSSKFMILPDNKKSKSLHKKKKNPKWHNYSNRNNYSSTKQSCNLSPKVGNVKWHETISSKQPSPELSISATKNETEKFSRTSDKRIEWTVTPEKKTLTRLSSNYLIDKDKKVKSHKLIDVNETIHVNSSPKFSKRKHPYAGKSCLVKDNGKVQDIQNNIISKTCMEQDTGYGIWEEIDYLDHYSDKNNLNKSNDLTTNKNVNSDDEISYPKKLQNYNHTTYPKNATDTINHSSDFLSKVSKFSHQTNKIIPRAQYDQFINLPTENLNQQTLTKEALNNTTLENLKPYQEQNTLIQFGKEISDLIIGSHTALSTLFLIYGEWKLLRYELIDQFKQLEKAIHDSSQKYKMYQDVLKVGSGIVDVATNIPHPYVGMAAKIVSILTSLASKFFKTSDTVNINVDEPEITRLLFKDIRNSSELYMHGLQCNLQFEETTKLIEEFHSNATTPEFSEVECPDILTFLRGVLEYRPRHRIFYKKLHKCFQELLQNGTSQYSRKFCEPFTLYSTNAVDVVGYLDWHFIEVDNASVEQELKGMLCLLQNSTSMKDLALRIKNCIRILNDELESVIRSLSKVPLLDVSEQNFKLK